MVIKAKMEETYSHRRPNIVEERPMIGDFKDRWPALFKDSGVSTSVHLYAGVKLTQISCLLTFYAMVM